MEALKLQNKVSQATALPVATQLALRVAELPKNTTAVPDILVGPLGGGDVGTVDAGVNNSGTDGRPCMRSAAGTTASPPSASHQGGRRKLGSAAKAARGKPGLHVAEAPQEKAAEREGMGHHLSLIHI